MFFIHYFYSKDDDLKRRASSKLRELSRKGEGIVPTVVLSEVVKVTCEDRGLEEAILRYHSIKQSGLSIVDLTPEIALEAGKLKCRYRDVPMGDCIIAATGKTLKARILTRDPHIQKIREVKVIWI